MLLYSLCSCVAVMFVKIIHCCEVSHFSLESTGILSPSLKPKSWVLSRKKSLETMCFFSIRTRMAISLLSHRTKNFKKCFTACGGRWRQGTFYLSAKGEQIWVSKESKSVHSSTSPVLFIADVVVPPALLGSAYYQFRLCPFSAHQYGGGCPLFSGYPQFSSHGCGHMVEAAFLTLSLSTVSVTVVVKIMIKHHGCPFFACPTMKGAHEKFYHHDPAQEMLIIEQSNWSEMN